MLIPTFFLSIFIGCVICISTMFVPLECSFTLLLAVAQQILASQEGHGGEAERRELPQVGLPPPGGDCHGGGGKQEVRLQVRRDAMFSGTEKNVVGTEKQFFLFYSNGKNFACQITKEPNRERWDMKLCFTCFCRNYRVYFLC